MKCPPYGTPGNHMLIFLGFFEGTKVVAEYRHIHFGGSIEFGKKVYNAF